MSAIAGLDRQAWLAKSASEKAAALLHAFRSRIVGGGVESDLDGH